MKYQSCFSLNFGYFDPLVKVPQISVSIESDILLNFNHCMEAPSCCFLVFIGDRYHKYVGKIMEKINSFSNDIGGTRPLAVFLIKSIYNKDLVLDLNYGFDRFQSTPIMVKMQLF